MVTDAQISRLAQALECFDPAEEIAVDLAARRGPDGVHPSCWEIEAFACEDTGSEAIASHLAGCLECRQEAAAFRTLQAEQAGERRAAAIALAPRPRWHTPIAAVASSIQPRATEGPDVQRRSYGQRGAGSLIQVAVATTGGPATVVGLSSLAPPCHSTMIVRGTAHEVLGHGSSPNSYDELVKLETGVIERLFGRAPFLMQVSRSIDAGESWQAGVLLAHAAHARERLAMQEESSAGCDIVAWVTGIVEPQDFSLRPVAQISEKLACSLAFFEEARRCGKPTYAFLPDQNRGDLERLDADLRRRLEAAGVQLVPLETAGQMFERLNLRGTEDYSPYRGLRRFESGDRALFFGRRHSVALALQRLRQGFEAGCPFLLISGASGVGKSSLARAGILTSLEQLPDDSDWRTAILDLQEVGPTDLVGALASALGLFWPDRALTAQPDPAVFAARVKEDLRGRSLRPARWLLLVDQMERLFTLGATAEAIDAFARTLAALTASQSVWIVATIRPDFLPQLSAVPALTALVRGGDFTLLPPRREELREIIAGPMQLWGLTAGTDPQRRSLVDVILDVAGTASGSLPLLQYTLDVLVRQLADERDTRRVLSWEAYQRLGGLTGAIGKRVEEELRPLGGMAAMGASLEALIRSLAQIDYRTGTAVARRVPLADIAAFDPPLVDLLTRLRLVVVDDTAMQVAHEALLREWSIARDVLRRDAAELRLREQLEQLAALWRDALPADRRSRLLPPGKPLTDGVDLLERRGKELPPRILAFIEASRQRDAQDRESIRLRREMETRRFAQDEQRALDRIARGDFAAAAEDLREIARFLENVDAEDLRARLPDITARQLRISRLAGFFAAAREADTFAGQEDFGRALPRCRQALHHLAIDDPDWLDKLPVQDVSEAQIRGLEQEAYRTLLLYSGLQLVPALELLGVRMAGKAAAPGPVIWSKAVALAMPVMPHLIAGIGPLLLPAILRRGGLPGLFRLPRRRDCPEALAELDKARTALDRVSALEARLAAASEHREHTVSRTSQLVRQLLELFTELASPPAGEPIDYQRWLRGGWSGPPPVPINSADYFFVGLFNYFAAKRARTWLPRALVLVRSRFPDLDGRQPVAAANRLLRFAVALEPQNFWAHWVLGRTLLIAGDHAGAELAFNGAISLRPAYARGYEQRALALGHLWRKERRSGLRERALADSQMARKLAGGDPSMFWPRGELLELLNDPVGALDSYARWLTLEQNLPALIARTSGLDELEHRTTVLEKRARLGMVGAPLRAAALAVRAHVRLIRKDYGRARGDVEAALRLVPEQPHALTAKGMIAYRLGDPAAALESLEQAIAASRGVPNYRALYERARVRASLRQDPEALLAWHELRDSSAQPAADRCPPWMLAEAEHAIGAD